MQEIINQLRELSFNLYWSWTNDFYEVFEEINKDTWIWSQKNPVKFLEVINQQYLFDMIEKRNLREKITAIYVNYKKYLSGQKYYDSILEINNKPKDNEPKICYLSAEFGITKCLRFYSGGLGVLSGDHLKSSSDLGLPLVAVGLGYLYGYFTQFINENGVQSELYERSDFNRMPMNLLTDDHYKPIKVSVELPGRIVNAQVWVVKIGNIKLYLLDTFVDENMVDDKRITDILYGGNIEKRIQQEIFLGIGGKRLMNILGHDIKTYHMNEGHSAFLCFERIKSTMQKSNISFAEAKKICYESNIFTTHTPVPAGIDIFTREMMEHYFKGYAEKELKISFDEFFNEGDLNKNDEDNNRFNMAYLAINNSKYVNGVSKLHGDVSRKMWNLSPDRSQIKSITNGIHTLSYISKTSESLYEKYHGHDWLKKEKIWEAISNLPDTDIWRMRKRNRLELIKFVRNKTYDILVNKGEFDEYSSDLSEILDEKALTIGFARRFATYKRGTFIFKDIERLKKIISNPQMPVQFVFSGKAHPKDMEGKHFIEEIIAFTQRPEFKNKIIFLENYELDVAKKLVHGCDLWLNNPRRPLEASGTSGMKVIPNGGLNFSILDGWWAEAYSPDYGWKIDSVSESQNLSQEEKDWIEVNSMYSVLENEIIPAFYLRNEKNLPVQWIAKIKNSMRDLAGYFNTGRMVREYFEEFYSKSLL